MCGLVAMLSKRQWGFHNKEVETFEEILTVDQLRGQDATGTFCVHRNKQVSGIKLAATPWHLFKQPEYANYHQKACQTGKILVGHNRKATQGTATDPANAHPFQENHIILVHNGSLYNRRGLPQRDVDSHAVAAAFSVGNYDEILSNIDGAFAFIWWDMKRNQLSVVRNKERPLWKIENKDMVVFCSEAWMGGGVLRRNGIGTSKGEEFEYKEVPVDTVFHYDVNGKLESEEAVKKAQVVLLPTPTNTTTTNNGVNMVKTSIPTTHTPPIEQMVRAPFPFPKVPFKVGDRILVQINRVISNTVVETAQNMFKAIGMTVEPGKQIIDAVGYLPNYVTMDSVERWQQYPVSAEITEIHTNVNGPSVTLKHFSMTRLIQTHPSGVITEKEWEYVVDQCGCKHCNAAIGEYEPGFTSVKPIVIGDKRLYEVTCADCIEERIQDQEVKTEFTEGRIDALQKWEQVLGSTGKRVDQSIEVQGNSTTH